MYLQIKGGMDNGNRRMVIYSPSTGSSSAIKTTILNSISVMENQAATETTSVSTSQQNQPSPMSLPGHKQLHQATGPIAIDLKLFKEKLDVDCRFEVYKQAFPEIDRANLPKERLMPNAKDRIHILYTDPCEKIDGLHPPSTLPPPCDLDKPRGDDDYQSGQILYEVFDEELYNDGTYPKKIRYEWLSDKAWSAWYSRNCSSCICRSENQIYRMLTSNFCKDKGIRKELLQYYFRFVQFEWAQGSGREQWCERSPTKCVTLPRFFEAFQPSGLTEQLKHLSLDIPWNYTYPATAIANSRTRCIPSSFDKNEAFREDALIVGRVFGVLHKYKIKAELKFLRTWEYRRPYIQRVEELCRTHLRRDGPEFWKEYDAQTESIFCDDVELRRLADEFVENENIYTGGAVYNRFECIPWDVTYDIDFRQ